MSEPLTNGRHERFAQELARGLSVDAAYVAAGFKANRGNAARLNANESVRRRVMSLRMAAAEHVKIDASWVLTKAVELHALALTKDKMTVAARSLEIVGKHIDVQAFKDRVEVNLSVDRATELDRFLRDDRAA